MSYQVLALKYRPQTFDDVVGQNHVIQTLINAIASDRVAHALLFTGPRGTGKTTIARIVAKAMNCKDGPTSHPCNTCKICTDIIEGHCADVFEIDGASNNSVDQIRDLRENVTYMPSSALYKIYIIDEVHMLSTAAFNALLKTLEEPPEHVLFIFATTEVHKIPATILSRCQRHDLGRISLPLISNHLNSLCRQEGYEIDVQSLDLIAQEADGSIRDALSLLDRILSLASNNSVEHQQVLDGLGVLDRQIMHDMSAAIIEKNGAHLIELIERINNTGTDLKQFYSDLILHFRNLNIIKHCGKDCAAVNAAETEKLKFFQTTSSLSSGYILSVLQVLLDEESIVRYASDTKTAIEMVVLKLIQIDPGAQIDTIISKVDALAKKIGSGACNQAYPSGSYDSHSDKDVIQEEIKPQNQHLQAADNQHQPEPERTWQGFLIKIEQSFPFMFALLSKGRIKEESDNKIIVEIKNGSAFNKKRIKSQKADLQTICKKFLEKDLIINIQAENSSLNKRQKKKDKIKRKQAAFNHPLVVGAQKLFNGEIIN